MVRPLKKAVTDLEYELIDEALTESDGNVKAAAQLLDINRSWLNRRIVTFKINVDAYRPTIGCKKKTKAQKKKKVHGKKSTRKKSRTRR